MMKENIIKFLKIIFGIEKKKCLNADNARKIYSHQKSQIDFRIKEIDDDIVDGAKYGKRIVTYVISDLMEPITDKLVEHYLEQGFFVKKYKYEEVPEFHVLIIGW